MAKGEKKGTGFQQAAGLIRYFDAEEETAIRINPYAVLVASFLTAALVLFFNLSPWTRLR